MKLVGVLMLVAALVASVVASPAVADSSGKSSANKPATSPPLGSSPAAPRSDAILLYDPAKFFQAFFSEKTPPAKDQFETDEEYQKRIQPKLDFSRTYYFVVPPPEYSEQFKYDIKSGNLTLIAGDNLSTLAHDKAAKGTVPICLFTDLKNNGSYDATNGFGAPVSVTSFDMTEYVLDIANPKAISDFLDFHNNRLVIGKTILDRDEAKRLSADGEVVVGVELLGFKSSNSVQQYDEATFDKPRSSDSHVFYIDADVKSLLLVDKAKNAPIAGRVIK